MYTGKEGEVNSRILYPKSQSEEEEEGEEEEGEENPQLSTHPTRRRSGLDIRRDSQSLEISVAGDLRKLARVQT
jgi:hypothetical protein